MRVLLISWVIALVLAGGALANKNRIDKADQAAVQHEVLRSSDLPSTVKWQGGAIKPDNSSSFTCPGYHPKDSDLVTTGDAESKFSTPGLTVDSEVGRLETAKMLELDWKRSVVPAIIPCVGRAFAHAAHGTLTILSVHRVSFPSIATHTVDYRVLFRTSATKPQRGIVDLILVGSGRTEITLTVLALLGAPSSVTSGEAVVGAFDERLARLLAKRALEHKVPPALTA
jgi:hypothetical protein